jgi:hypothetical protein
MLSRSLLPVNAAAYAYLTSPPLQDWMWTRYASPVPKYCLSSWLSVRERSFVDNDLEKPLPSLLDAILKRVQVRCVGLHKLMLIIYLTTFRNMTFVHIHIIHMCVFIKYIWCDSSV